MARTSEMLIGSGVGDAYGLGLEMQGREKLAALTFDRWYNFRAGKYALGYTPGEYSDDTEHSIGVVRTLISGDPFTEELLVSHWKQEYTTDAEKKGYPRQGHGSIEDYYLGRKTIEEIRESQARKIHPGNAPPMRAAILGLLPTDILFQYAEINANATHPHKEARVASSLVAYAAHFLLNGGNHGDLLADCADRKEFVEIKDWLLKVNGYDDPERINNDEFATMCGPQPIQGAEGLIYGLPSSAIHTAITSLFILKHTKDAFVGLRRSIQMGGDVDSLATICVGILAGRYGIQSLPEFILTKLEGKQMLHELGKSLDQYLHTI